HAQNVMKILSAELPTKQAAELAAKITGENKKELYNLALTWKV
ncbi:rRNA (cytidine-2'-O-)-methyltransferase, partial [Kingella kingae]|nr:rRNA (cytidine-2'-O-)-methyltransferase [Kingella kingae]